MKNCYFRAFKIWASPNEILAKMWHHDIMWRQIVTSWCHVTSKSNVMMSCDITECIGTDLYVPVSVSRGLSISFGFKGIMDYGHGRCVNAGAFSLVGRIPWYHFWWRCFIYNVLLALWGRLRPSMKVNSLIAYDNGVDRITERAWRVIQTWYNVECRPHPGLRIIVEYSI